MVADRLQLEDLLHELQQPEKLPDDAGPDRWFFASQRQQYLLQVKELIICWGRLQLFIDGIQKWSNADGVVVNCGSVIAKVEAKADLLGKQLSTLNQQKPSREKQLSSLAMMVSEFQAQALEFSDLDAEMARVVDSILGSFSLVKIRSPCHDLSLWIKFARSAGEIMRFLDQKSFSPRSSFPPMVELACFIGSVHQEFQLGPILISGDQKGVIEGFFAHVAPVVFRVACLCCPSSKPLNLPRLRVLVDEISYDNLKFLDITLRFMKTLNEIRCSPTSASQADLVKFFVSSFCASGTFLHKELTEIVTHLMDSPEEPFNEEDKYDIAEIKQVIARVVCFLRLGPIRGTIVGMKIWLRKVGLFLKERLRSSKKIFKHPTEFFDCLNQLEEYFNEKMATSNYSPTEEKEVSGELKSLYESYSDKKIEECMVRFAISQLLSKVALLRAKPALSDLSIYCDMAISHCREELWFLLEHIKLFISTVTVVKAENIIDEDNTFTRIESVCLRTLYLCYLFRTGQINEEASKKTVADLLEQLQMVKKNLVLEIPEIKFPHKCAGMGFLDRVLGNLWELCKRETNSFLRDAMEKFHMELGSLRYELLEWKDAGDRLTKLIYETEYVIDSIEVGIGAQWQHILWINNLHREIAFTKTSEDRGHHASKNTSRIARAGKAETDQKTMVRLRDQEEVIIDRLTRGFSRRDLVPIVGMPGVGKTTLAKTVYNHTAVLYHFHRRAWCFVSQSYEKRDSLLKLLGDIHGLTDEIQDMDDADLELKLWKCLKGNRYLIVMDDVWDVGAWKDLQTSFPDDGNGSRIMITSRQCNMFKVDMPVSNPHQLRTLSADESWKLLEMRIFQEGRCPEELVQTGKEIAEQCKGLALAVVAVAGMLEKTEKKKGSWQQILKGLNTQVIDDPVTQCKSILEMSYNHLPDHVKVCFLYFGVFQQDRDVQVKKLIQMWIAEGFIQNTEQKALEEEGEISLTELIDRSLVTVSRRKSTGGVKACRMHDLLHDLCLSKSKEEQFLQLISCYDEPYASFPNLYDGVVLIIVILRML